MSGICISRYHDISCGHRIVGHEGKCAGLHGHNYRITFTASAEKLDSLGRVVDFSVLKTALCDWLEENWDHKFLYWEEDGVIDGMLSALAFFSQSLVAVPFNPTAENIAHYLLTTIGPQQLEGTGVTLQMVKVEETRKCSALAMTGAKDERH